MGIHTGKDCFVTISPAPENTGIIFRVDGVEIEALHSNVVNTSRATCLGKDGVRLDTVEHLLSACAGLKISNVIIDVEGPEIPILDGSAIPWVEELLKVGIEEMGSFCNVLRFEKTIVHQSNGSLMIAVPSENFSLTCVIIFDHQMLGTAAETFCEDPNDYVNMIAPARTFAMSEEIEKLKESGLALGGSLDNALVIYPDHFSSALRVENECLRHKALDLFGDLSLAGGKICAAVTAIRPGHKVNTEFAGILANNAKNYSLNDLADGLKSVKETESQGVSHARY